MSGQAASQPARHTGRQAGRHDEAYGRFSRLSANAPKSLLG
jgi:hypothetical protein